MAYALYMYEHHGHRRHHGHHVYMCIYMCVCDFLDMFVICIYGYIDLIFDEEFELFSHYYFST